MAKSM